MKKFLLVDDHTVVRSGMKGLLSETYNDTEIDEAIDGASAIEKLRGNDYDLVMMDVQMPNTDPLNLMHSIHVNYPLSKVLIFSMSPEKVYAKRFIKEGAKGFLSKEAPTQEIKKAVDLILNGKMYISENFARSFAEDSLSGTPDNPFDRLSPREFEIASLLLSGQTISEMSKSLNLQVSTIGTHKARLFEKLKISNILELKELAQLHNM